MEYRNENNFDEVVELDGDDDSNKKSFKSNSNQLDDIDPPMISVTVNRNNLNEKPNDEDIINGNFQLIDINSDKAEGSCNGAEAGSDRNSNDNDFYEDDGYCNIATTNMDTWFLNGDLAWGQQEHKTEEKEKEVISGWGNNNKDSDSKSNDEDNDDDYWGFPDKKKKKTDEFLPFQEPKKERGLKPWKHKKKEFYSNDDSDEEQIITVKRRR